MKILLISGLLNLWAFLPGGINCDNLKLDISLTHTTNGKANGKIEVVVQRGAGPFKVFLFASKREDNLEDVKFKDLKDLKSGEYILVVQDKESNCTFKQNVIIN